MFPIAGLAVPVGLLYGLGAAVLWGMTDVSASIAGRRLGSLRVLATSQVVGASTLAALTIPLGLAWPSDPWVVAAAILVGVAGCGAYLSFFTALRIGPLSVVSPITAAYGGLTVVLAVTLTGESLSGQQALGAAVATGGVMLAGLVFDDGLRSARIVGRGVAFSIVALVLFAVMTVGSAGPIRAAGWLPVVLIGRVTQVALAGGLLGLAATVRPRWLAPMLAGSEVGSVAPPRAVILAALAGLFDVVGLISFSIGLEVAETWLVGLASSFGPAIAVLVAVAVLGERLRWTQWVGLGLIAVGLSTVAVG
jgi:drug/metabolite transporter (DMT)-like permease